jgi:hypothetical protein
MVVVCEHHGMADGYLPSPLVLGTAIAARISSVAILIAAIVLPFYEPVHLAEDLACSTSSAEAERVMSSRSATGPRSRVDGCLRL